jgi:hypothetical protein
MFQLTPNFFPKSLTSINASNNMVSELENGTFTQNEKITLVDLRNNLLTNIATDAFSIVRGPNAKSPQVYLSGNVLECRCSLEWLTTFEKGDLNIQDYDLLNCSHLLTKEVHLRMCNIFIMSVFLQQHKLSEIAKPELLCPYTRFCTDCWCCGFDSCDCNQVCPTGCQCHRDNQHLSNIVNCDGVGKCTF